ncbi:MAG: hypothetical protein Q7J54_07180 [Candidatus Woesearchaeota archaeon]|nr:hypothetical protein [Candidatus Woesearchaeota archaeon]
MDFEIVNKINNLAKELLRTGTAESAEDAYEQAKRIVGGSEGEEIKEEVKPDDEGFTFLRSRMNEYNQKMEKEINNLNAKLSSIVDDIEKLRQDVASLNRDIEVKQHEKTAEKPEQETRIEPKRNMKQTIKGQEVHFSPDEVAVDKIFYFGKK